MKILINIRTLKEINIYRYEELETQAKIKVIDRHTQKYEINDLISYLRGADCFYWFSEDGDIIYEYCNNSYNIVESI